MQYIPRGGGPLGRALSPVVPTLYWADPRYFATGTGTQTVSNPFSAYGSFQNHCVVSAPAAVTINPATGALSVNTASAFAWTVVWLRAYPAQGMPTDIWIDLRVVTGTKTIDLGVSQAYYSVTPVAGDVVWVRAGTSSEVWHLNGGGWNAGTSGAPIEVLAYPGETVTINVSALTTNAAIYAGETQYLIIRGLIIVGGANVANGISLWKSHHVTVAQCSISGFQRFGIIASSDERSACHHNVAEYNRITNCVLENSARSWATGWATALRFDVCDGAVARRNRVYLNYGEGIGFLACTGATATENVCYDNFSVNLYLDGVQNTEVHGNILWSNNSAFYKSGNPANSILAANEDYGSSTYLMQNTFGLVATGNFYLSTNVAPFYDASFSVPGTGPGAGTTFTPNATFSSPLGYWT